MVCRSYFVLIFIVALDAIKVNAQNYVEACENYMGSCLPCYEDMICNCTKTKKIVTLPCLKSSNSNYFIKVYTDTWDGTKSLICPTEHEYTSYLPSKNNLISKHTIQHYCRCRDQLEKVFPFQDCPDLKAFEVTLAPQSCSNQHSFFCPTYAPPTPCPTPITPVCNCNCTYPNSIKLEDVCKNQSGVSSATPSTETETKTPSTTTPSTTTPSTTTPSTATPSNSKIPQECARKCKSSDKQCVNLINSTLSLISNLANASTVQNAELRDLTESVKLLWLTMVCVFVLLLVVTVLQVAVLLAIHCRSEEPSKKIDIVMLDEIIRPNVKDDDGIMITNDMYGRF